MTDLTQIRARIRDAHLADEDRLLAGMTEGAGTARAASARAVTRGAALVEDLRHRSEPGLMEVFLAEYGLSTEEGVALMCLAEALLRVPDTETIDALIEDKIAPSAWGAHLGRSSSSLVNASTWALMLTGKVLTDPAGPGMASVLRRAVRRLGEPVIRTAVGQAMREMGRQFVLGTTIKSALERAARQEEKGYTYSYDMLGEAARTYADADSYFAAYRDAIAAVGKRATSGDVRGNPGISIKLSALHPRYEETQRDRVMDELLPRARDLARQAKAAGMGLNIDAEEADRLELSLDLIAALLADPELAGWDGFGVVVQAYGKRAAHVLDWLHALAVQHDRRIMVRLVKGAYWDTEIKRAQVEGLDGFPVFTRKPATDVSYICCASKLLGMTDRIYPQFATHNAHTVAAILEMADDRNAFEFQRLHGMGEALHARVRGAEGTRCRIYAPVGAHRDLLAYLVRRLLENGANSSFVHQILDADLPAEAVAADPFAAMDRPAARAVVPPAEIFGAGRRNSRGWDIHDPVDLQEIDTARAPHQEATWKAGPLIAGPVHGARTHPVVNPANPGDTVGEVTLAAPEDVETALAAARPWQADADARAEVLNRAADLYEQNFGPLFAVLAREAGKVRADAIAELREAVDFLRYYATEGQRLEAGPRGVFACISPWNFPLAIFTGQIAAALSAGNGVIAKPAEPTPLIAHLAVGLLHEAGVPATALQLLPGEGPVVGAALSGDPRIAGIAFTGSTATAQRIHRSMAETLDPRAPLIAETGGLNAMIVDSSALPEQAVEDIVASAFQSAGQRCSALRMLYVQEDVADRTLKMLYGAMDALRLGDPWELSTDVGPVITATARKDIQDYVDAARQEGRLLKQMAVPQSGHFIGPAVLRSTGIGELEREVFGPVLHVATFRAEEIGRVIEDINASGYGLTFGIHSRIDDRIEAAIAPLRVGNIYVNRNQIGAVVGSQPFGGMGMSGTGPKAGGPAYVPRFALAEQVALAAPKGAQADLPAVQKALNDLPRPALHPLETRDLPGPTGESNRLSTLPRGRVLCLGPTADAAREQARIARAAGCTALCVAPGLAPNEGIAGRLDLDALGDLDGFELVALWAEAGDLAAARQALARRDGPIAEVVGDRALASRCVTERHVCIDTTAAGGNAALLAAAG